MLIVLLLPLIVQDLTLTHRSLQQILPAFMLTVLLYNLTQHLLLQTQQVHMLIPHLRQLIVQVLMPIQHLLQPILLVRMRIVHLRQPILLVHTQTQVTLRQILPQLMRQLRLHMPIQHLLLQTQQVHMLMQPS